MKLNYEWVEPYHSTIMKQMCQYLITIFENFLCFMSACHKVGQTKTKIGIVWDVTKCNVPNTKFNQNPFYWQFAFISCSSNKEDLWHVGRLGNWKECLYRNIFLFGWHYRWTPPDAVHNLGCVLSFTVYHFLRTQNTYRERFGVLK